MHVSATKSSSCIVLCIPSPDFRIGNLDHLMGNLAIRMSDDRLAALIVSKAGKNLHPNKVVDSADGKATKSSALGIPRCKGKGHVQRDTDDEVCSIPEAHIASSCTFVGWVPRRNEQIEVG